MRQKLHYDGVQKQSLLELFLAVYFFYASI